MENLWGLNKFLQPFGKRDIKKKYRCSVTTINLVLHGRSANIKVLQGLIEQLKLRRNWFMPYSAYCIEIDGYLLKLDNLLRQAKKIAKKRQQKKKK